MKRISELDVIRSFCFIWIVGVWHMNSYLMPSIHYSGYLLDVFHNITSAALGMFTFLSGVLLSKYQFLSFNDAVLFYRKRLSKFFFLLLISALTYNLVGWINLGQVVQVIFGMNLFIGPSVPTLWFFSMMIFYYLITPVMLTCYSNKYQTLSHFLIPIVIIILFFVAVKLCGSDKRLLFYFPMYLIGLNTGSDKLVRIVHSKWLYTAIPIIALLFLGRIHPIIAELIGGLIFILCGKLAFPTVNGVWRVISVSSMIAYLFHRQLFSIIKRVFEQQGVDYIPLIVAVMIFGLLIIVSYYAQTIIDNFKKQS